MIRTCETELMRLRANTSAFISWRSRILFGPLLQGRVQVANSAQDQLRTGLAYQLDIHLLKHL